MTAQYTEHKTRKAAAYTTDDKQTAMVTFAIYGAMIIVYIPNVILAIKGFRKMERCEGPFAEETEEPETVRQSA